MASTRLHNDHNVYVLGAGFSRERGLPLISDFMLQMRDALSHHQRFDRWREAEAIERVLEFRLKAASAAYRVKLDLENIEELFSLASASPDLSEKDVRLAIAATLDFSMSKPEPTVQLYSADAALQDISGWESFKSIVGNQESRWNVPLYQFYVKALLGDWHDGRPEAENTFITFNYDTVLEQALTGLGQPYSLGFEDPHLAGREEKSVGVLKLHGSVDWALAKGARTKIRPRFPYREVIGADLTPEIIPPTWKKDSRGAFQSVWESALSQLSRATRVVVLGFSIPPTDLHFKYLMAAGLQTNHSLREILFVNPAPSGLEERINHLFANQEFPSSKVRTFRSDLKNFVCNTLHQDFHLGDIGRHLPAQLIVQ